MEFAAYLNERSFSELAPSIAIAKQSMTNFINLYRKLTTRVPLHALGNLSQELLADDYPVSKWRNDPAVELEQRTYFRTISHRVPFFQDDDAAIDACGAVEVILDDEPSPACTSAYVGDGLTITISETSRWDTTHLEVELRELDEAGDVVCRTHRLPHACKPEHLSDHAIWLDLRLRIIIEVGSDLWHNRSGLFPNLSFCPSVEKDLENLQQSQVRGVHERLVRLQAASSRWADEDFPHEVIGHANPDSQATLEQYWQERLFVDSDGIEHIFSWHVRIGQGRMYYKPLHAGSVLVGYIGRHLPTVKYPTI